MVPRRARFGEGDPGPGRFNRQIHELLAPDVFPIEVAHALSRAERRGLITPPAGSQHLSDLLASLGADTDVPFITLLDSI